MNKMSNGNNHFGTELLFCQYVSLILCNKVVLLLLGGMLSFIREAHPGSTLGQVVNEVENINPHVVFWLFLPPLLYEDSSTMNWHVGSRVMINSKEL
jgi:hypothetical protein